MKKSIAYAVSKGLILLACSQAAFAEGVEYKVAWDQEAERYRVYMKPDATPRIDRTLSAQVTLRIPHGTLSEGFTDAGIDLLSTRAGAIWNASSKTFAPVEDTSTDYISFTPTLSDQSVFALTAGQEQELFSFHTQGVCLGSVTVMDNDTDPFNPASGKLNSAQSNPGNEFSSLMWAGANDFLGVYGTAAICEAKATNTDPVAGADTASVQEGASVDINILANDTDADGDTLTLSAKTNGQHGTVSLKGDNAVTYTPNAGFIGTDTFTYTATDGRGGSVTGTVSVTVTAEPVTNNKPVAGADTASVQEGDSVAIDVLANDTDAEGDGLTLTAVGSALGGVTRIQDGKVVYVADSGFSGEDRFDYRVSDAKGAETTARVTVTVISDSDRDGDGLDNDDEIALKTDPDKRDTDGDGVNDADEVGSDLSNPLDTDRDGTINALDDDDDNDSILSVYENYNGGSLRHTDSDFDGKPDYLDVDDDNDGLLTVQESPDQNGDGNPSDALDSNRDGRPDYLQRPGQFAPNKVQPVPTLGHLGIILMSFLLTGAAIRKHFLNKAPLHTQNN